MRIILGIEMTLITSVAVGKLGNKREDINKFLDNSLNN